MIDFDQLAGTLNRMSDVIKQMKQHHQAYNEKVDFCRTISNEEIYEKMSSSFSSWSSSLSQHVKCMQNYVGKTVKYTSLEIESINQLMRLRNQTGYDYTKQWNELEAKKDKLFSAGYSPSWMVDFKQTKISENEFSTDRDMSKCLMLPEVSLLVID